MPHLEDTERIIKALQTAIGIIGTLASAVLAIFPAIRRWLGLHGERSRNSFAPGEAASAEAKASNENATTHSFAENLSVRFSARHGSIELAFSLLFAAIFSVVFSDALLDERVAATNPLQAFISAVLLTAFLAALTTGAWFQRQLEFVVGTLSVTAMLVLLLSTRSAFLDSQSGIDSGSLLLVPLLGLLVAASGSISFLFGNPFGRGVNRRHSILWGIAVVGVVGLAAGVVGRQKVLALEADPRSPRVSGVGINKANIAKVITSVSSLSPVAQKAFFQFASDLQLASEYRSEHAITESRLRGDHQVLERFTASSKPSSSASPAASAPAETRPDPSSPPPDAPSTFVNRSDAQLEGLRRSELRRSVLNSTVERFKALAPQSRSQYMRTRLTWIHPLGSAPGEFRAAIPLPETTTRARFVETSTLRVNHAFAANDEEPSPKPRSSFSPLSSLFDTSYTPEPAAPDTGPDIRGAFEYEPPVSPLRKNALFPPLPKDVSLVDLRTQLTWPREAEAWIAYEEYKDIAYSEYSGAPRKLLEQYDALTDSERGAFRELLAVEKNSNDRLSALSALAASAIDLAAITDARSVTDLHLIARKLQFPTESIAFPDERGKQLAEQLVTANQLNIDQKKTLAELLEQSLAQKLFAKDALGLASNIMTLFDKEARPNFFRVLSEPVEKGVLNTAAAKHGSSAESAIPAQLALFLACTPEERESILLRFAKDLYGAGGNYAFLPHQQLIYTAGEVNRAFAIVVAGLLTLPFFVLAVFAGTAIARRLRAHHRHRALLEREVAEHSQLASAENVGKSKVVRGRDSFLKSLVALGGRGWTTTAVAGRRGVGKSRALQELLRGSSSDPPASSESRIAVWVSAPTEFDEKEFVLTMLERLADSVETTVARFLKAEPFAVRRAEAKIASVAVALFVVGAVFAWWLTLVVQPDSDAVTIAISVLPPVTLLGSGMLLLVLHVVRLQPVNLEPWLEKDRTQQVATALLYRDASRVRATTSSIRSTSRWALLGASLPAAAIVALLGVIGLRAAQAIRSADALFTFAVIFSATALWRTFVTDRLVFSSRAQGYMSLISSYRSFAETVVRRLREGALGMTTVDGNAACRVVVAIDELDKMPTRDIRTFVRRIKAVFEVPGVYYYVSISEDALMRLYLGASNGKDEFDSSFDHIVQLQPLKAPDAALAALDYLQNTGIKYSDSRLPMMIGAASLGVPRDVLRRVDEVRDLNPTTSVVFARHLRHRMAELGYRSDLISREQAQLLRASASEIDERIQATLAEAAAIPNSRRRSSVLRFWISCWVVAALEVAAGDADDQCWGDRAEALRDLGYRVAIDPPDDLVAETLDKRKARLTSETRITNAKPFGLLDSTSVAEDSAADNSG